MCLIVDIPSGSCLLCVDAKHDPRKAHSWKLAEQHKDRAPCRPTEATPRSSSRYCVFCRALGAVYVDRGMDDGTQECFRELTIAVVPRHLPCRPANAGDCTSFLPPLPITGEDAFGRWMQIWVRRHE
jgi:hypothetical protein